jgi:hypothetical protein
MVCSSSIPFHPSKAQILSDMLLRIARPIELFCVSNLEFRWKLNSRRRVNISNIIKKVVHVYFSHMTYLMSRVTSLNNTR